MAIAKYNGDPYGARLTFQYRGPAASVRFELDIGKWGQSLGIAQIISPILSLGATTAQVSTGVEGRGTWGASSSVDTSLDARVVLRAVDVPGVSPGAVIWDSGWVPNAYLSKAVVVPIPTPVLVYDTYEEPSVVTADIVAAADAGATSVAVISPEGSYTVDVSSTTEAATISGLSYTDWINLYTYGIMPPRMAYVPGAWQIAGPQIGRTLMGSASGQGFWR